LPVLADEPANETLELAGFSAAFAATLALARALL
jgi:hypothetical protein